MTATATRELQNKFGVRADRTIYQYLSLNGDGTGGHNMVGDYSVTPATFYYQAPSGKQATLNRMIILIEDATQLTAAGYGGMGALTTGIHISVHDEEDVQVKLLTPEYITTNAEWGGVCHDVAALDFGPGANAVSVRWTFGNAGTPLILNPGWRLTAELADSFIDLITHTMMVQGYELDSEF